MQIFAYTCVGLMTNTSIHSIDVQIMECLNFSLILVAQTISFQFATANWKLIQDEVFKYAI